MARFIEGQGWLVDEGSNPAPPAPGASAVVAGAKQGNALSGLGLAKGSTTDDLSAALSERGMVVLTVDDHDSLLVIKEEHEKLKTAHAELQRKMAGIDSLATNEGLPAIKGKVAKRTVDEMEVLITSATTLDQLTELMKDEERKTVLKLGDARAVEIQEGKL